MAASDIQRVVSIIFAGEDRLSPAARAAQRTLSEFGTGLSGSVDALAGFTAGAARLEAGILATGAAAAVFAVNTAATFDQNFRGLTTLIEEPTSALSGFRQSILDYAQGSTQPLEQITQALGDAIGSGVRWQDSLALLRVAEQGAVAGQAQLGESTRLLVGTSTPTGSASIRCSASATCFSAPSATARSRSAIWQTTSAASRRSLRRPACPSKRSARRWPC